jgi:phosphoenolpyruvate---glycerone phosphotransferase subunit DhaL
MPRELVLALVDAAAAAVATDADELTRLDQAIGDGDHGTNLQRGFQAIAAQREALAGLELGDALQKAGMVLVTTVGGASGPLYGSLLMGIGKALKAGRSPTEAFAEGVESVKRRGKSDAGAKTMLDVLVPALDALREHGETALGEFRRAATEGREATKPMRATRGRASFLGERSVGHHDPGATSACVLIHAICDVLEGRRA